MKKYIKRFALFLIRRSLCLKKFEHFRFDNQKSDAYYYFTDCSLMKHWDGYDSSSHVSLNWILDNNCRVIKVGDI